MKRYKFLTDCSTWPGCAGNWNRRAPLPGRPIHKGEKEAFNFSIGNFIARKQSTFPDSEEKPEGEFSPRPQLQLYCQPRPELRAHAIPDPWDCLQHFQLCLFFGFFLLNTLSVFLFLWDCSEVQFATFLSTTKQAKTSLDFVVTVFLRFSALHPIADLGLCGKHPGVAVGHANIKGTFVGHL